jgi:hypothetical protein
VNNPCQVAGVFPSDMNAEERAFAEFIDGDKS